MLYISLPSLQVIAILCQVTGVSTGQHWDNTYKVASNEQLSCQKWYVSCMKKSKAIDIASPAFILTNCIETREPAK